MLYTSRGHALPSFSLMHLRHERKKIYKARTRHWMCWVWCHVFYFPVYLHATDDGSVDFGEMEKSCFVLLCYLAISFDIFYPLLGLFSSAAYDSATVRQKRCHRGAFEYNDTCYYFPFGTVTKEGYSEAKAMCECRGGQLVSITDRDTATFINRALEQKDPAASSTSPFGTYWIGLRQESCPIGNQSYSQLQWEDGSCPVTPVLTLNVATTDCRSCVVLSKTYAVAGRLPEVETAQCSSSVHSYICQEPLYLEGKQPANLALLPMCLFYWAR